MIITKKNAWEKIQIYINVLNYGLIFTVAIYITYVSYRYGSTYVTWHAWLCTFGYQVLMTQAILALYSQNVLSQHNSRNIQRRIHWIMQLIGSLMAIAGIIIEFNSTYIDSHFNSLHAILGLIAISLTGFGLINGTLALFSIELKNYLKPIKTKFFHNLVGTSAFVVGMIALFFGYEYDFLFNGTPPEAVRWCQAVAIITIILSLFGAIRSMTTQAKSISAGICE